MTTKILLADDETDLEDLFRQQFRQQIQAKTYEFIFATDGQQALAILEQHPDIDVLLSDINMPIVDGLTLLTKVPQVNPRLRTVIITAYGDMSNIRTAMNEGAFDFLTKPIKFSDLKKTLEKAIHSAAQQRELVELKVMDEMKTRFFANITHELRTPLSLIVAPVDNLLETAELPPAHQYQLATVQRNARQLLRLFNQLLDINKLEAQQMKLANEVGDLPEFVRQIVELFRPSANIKQLSLSYQTDFPTGNYVFDADKWEKILYNLLANAIKFTEAGGICVSLFKTSATAQLLVSDSGIGIDAEQLPHIFNRFYQVNQSSSRTPIGTGIGLALVHELVVRLGGTIRAYQQETGSGTHFLVELPIQSAGAEGASFNLSSLPQPDLLAAPPITVSSHAEWVSEQPETAPLLLIVEDNSELREFMMTELITTFRIRSAANGYDGWLIAKDEMPDLIVTDLVMPVQTGPHLDGYALIEQLRLHPETDHIPVVLLTASHDPAKRLHGLRAGVDDYLTKPFSMGELRLRLRNILNRQDKLREAYRRQLSELQANQRSEPMETVQDQFLNQLYQILESRLDDSTLSVEWLADELAMSRRKLHRKLQSLLQLSPHDVMRQYRLRKAVDLLRVGYNVSETAYKVGFESPSYFTKLFKEFYHQTPTDYTQH
ncbi:response regulator [Dyadobacter flavalbus]|uniref:histidine kinase n=1 Tax=Dyadobacter flavalbus TaxID=2579942 RepID=A0A5M8QVR6_9BACT|nr:response regulator [Dyadobacter flavalbus]KAA6438726.1 response regulator [Dyadobacter flavalbus]